MKLNKRELKQMERQLVVALTEACEPAKAEIPGFCWLTHDAPDIKSRQHLTIRRPGASMAKEIKNPCNSICQLDSGVCRGCGRTRAEIKAWKGMKRPEKQMAIKAATLRLEKQKKVS